MKFGTDGLRGIAGAVLTPDIVLKLGFYASVLQIPEFEVRSKAQFVVGKDPRLSSDMLEAALCSGIMLSGANVVLAGIVSTPVLPFVLKGGGYAGGFMITASHNPIEDNGIKVFDNQGFKLKENLEKKIEHRLNTRIHNLENIMPRFGCSIQNKILCRAYVNFVKKLTITNQCNMRSISKHPLKVVFDCAYGATSRLCKQIFTDVIDAPSFINAEFDGSKINCDCGATYLSPLANEVVKLGADMGFAFDGDGDRVLVVDSDGNEIDGDKILGILAVNSPVYAKSREVVATVMSNLGLEEYLSAHNIKLHREDVGDKYVMKGLLQRRLLLGGEQSGHIVMLDKSNAGDGLLTAASIIALVVKTGKSISELTSEIKKHPQILENVRVFKKEGWDKDEVVRSRISVLTKKCTSSSRLLVRPSGTESLIRVMAESRDPNKAQMLVKEAVKVIQDWNKRVNTLI